MYDALHDALYRLQAAGANGFEGIECKRDPRGKSPTVANAWIEARLANKTRAMAAFLQPLCVEDANFQPYVERVAPILSLPFTPIEVQRFDDEELARAWGDRRPALSEIPETVREFIRTPRIFRMARDHVEHLMQSGDPTSPGSRSC